MGKRRGSDEEDAGDPATTTSKINIKRELLGGEAEQQGTSSSGQPQQQKAHPKPFKRAKLEPFDWDNEMYGNLTAEVPRNTPLVNGHGSTAVSPAKRRLNGEHVEEQVPAEFQTVWLVRKPRNIPLEDLHKIRFTRKSKHRVQTVHGGCDMQCVMEAPPHTMMHLQCPEKSFGDQKAEMEPANSLRGIVQITEKLANSNPSGQMPSPADEEDDALFMSEPQNKAINTEVLAISTIRRKPREEGEEQCRERLQAYGCAETDHHPYLDEEDDDDEEEVGRTANRPKHWNIKEEKRI